MAQLNFNAAAFQSPSFDALPPGVYEAVIAASEMRPTKAGNGVGINLTFEIISEGAGKGRKLWTWINYQNPNLVAQQIGQEELAKICKAVGVSNLTATEQLHNIPLMITVALDKNDTTKNVVKSYKAKGATGAHVASAVDDGTPPWRR